MIQGCVSYRAVLNYPPDELLLVSGHELKAGPTATKANVPDGSISCTLEKVFQAPD
jgi:hypothetical protein